MLTPKCVCSDGVSGSIGLLARFAKEDFGLSEENRKKASETEQIMSDVEMGPGRGNRMG